MKIYTEIKIYTTHRTLKIKICEIAQNWIYIFSNRTLQIPPVFDKRYFLLFSPIVWVNIFCEGAFLTDFVKTVDRIVKY